MRRLRHCRFHFEAGEYYTGNEVFITQHGFEKAALDRALGR